MWDACCRLPRVAGGEDGEERARGGTGRGEMELPREQH